MPCLCQHYHYCRGARRFRQVILSLCGKGVNGLPSLLDIFAGCGGLSLGAHQAGFSTALAVDQDPLLSSSFPINFPNTKLLLGDVRALDRDTVNLHVPDGIDGVVGGPPCQAFSEMGRRAPGDPRRDLVLEFFRVVKAVEPKFFLFENVRGLTFPQNMGILYKGIASLPQHWRVLEPTVLNAADFGAPTSRRRLFVFGFNADRMDVPNLADLCKGTGVRTTVSDAIKDLGGATELLADPNGFDAWKYDGRRRASSYSAKLRSPSGIFTSHRRTEHTRDTLKRFAKLLPGKTDKIGKYKRLTWTGLCPTLRAGTGNDRGSYQAVRPIHPEDDRVITPREAARLQGYPDAFYFHSTVWHSCRMIGNSVSPVIAQTLFERIITHLPASSSSRQLLAAE